MCLLYNDEFEDAGLNKGVWKHRYVNEAYGAEVISEGSV